MPTQKPNTVKEKFIDRFCNDHNEKVRWLRGVSLNMETLLDDILRFLDEAQKEREK